MKIHQRFKIKNILDSSPISSNAYNYINSFKEIMKLMENFC